MQIRKTNLALLALLAMLLGGSASALEDPGLIPAGAPATVKITSAPLNCDVVFRGKTIRKTDGVLTYSDVAPGIYTVVFRQGNRTVSKTFTAQSGQSYIVFGDLTEGGTQTPSGAPIHRDDRLPDNSAMSYDDANDIFEYAEVLRKSVNPISKMNRYREAIALYSKIIQRWPEWHNTTLCHYQIAKINESIYFRNYLEAIDHYKRVIEIDFQTRLDARYRIARLYDRLKEYTKAREWYELAAKYTGEGKIWTKSTARAEDLKELGF